MKTVNDYLLKKMKRVKNQVLLCVAHLTAQGFLSRSDNLETGKAYWLETVNQDCSQCPANTNCILYLIRN